MPGGSTDEDCLHLNVTTPDGARPAHPRPVIVWLHGGGLTTGAGSSYDAHRMAVRGDVVVVTVDYRLGALGFLAHAGLPGSGTFGLADQQAALRWVRAEIGAFGGDAHRVTPAGESAGGYSVCAQLASPAAAGLFERAIIESGPCTGRPDRPFAPSSVPLSTARAAGTDLAAKAGCGSARDVPDCPSRSAGTPGASVRAVPTAATSPTAGPGRSVSRGRLDVRRPASGGQPLVSGPQRSGPTPRQSIHVTPATSAGSISSPARRRNSATSVTLCARPRISPSTRTRRPPVGDGGCTVTRMGPDMPSGSSVAPATAFQPLIDDAPGRRRRGCARRPAARRGTAPSE